jgi:hypothetical protein
MRKLTRKRKPGGSQSGKTGITKTADDMVSRDRSYSNGSALAEEDEDFDFDGMLLRDVVLRIY